MNAVSEWQRSWITAEAASHDTIAVKKIYIDINEGNLTDGVLFSQIMYWHMPSKQGESKMQVLRDGQLWLAKTYDDWFEECRIKSRTAREALRRIEKRGLIITHTWKFDGSPTKHIRINWEKFEEIVKSNVPIMSNGSDILCQNQLSENVRSLTETTTETTTEREEPARAASNPSNTSAPVVVPAPTPSKSFTPIRSRFAYHIPSERENDIKDRGKWVEDCRAVFTHWYNANGENGHIHSGNVTTLERRSVEPVNDLVLAGHSGEDVRAFIEWTFSNKNMDTFWKDKPAPLPFSHIMGSITGWKAQRAKAAAAAERRREAQAAAIPPPLQEHEKLTAEQRKQIFQDAMRKAHDDKRTA